MNPSTHLSAFQFRPQDGTSLIGFAAQCKKQGDYDWRESASPESTTYAAGCLEGELAFALSVDTTPELTLAKCRWELLLRLGLAGDKLTLEQERLKGWVVGMLFALESSLSEEIAISHKEIQHA